MNLDRSHLKLNFNKIQFTPVFMASLCTNFNISPYKTAHTFDLQFWIENYQLTFLVIISFVSIFLVLSMDK